MINRHAPERIQLKLATTVTGPQPHLEGKSTQAVYPYIARVHPATLPAFVSTGSHQTATLIQLAAHPQRITLR